MTSQAAPPDKVRAVAFIVAEQVDADHGYESHAMLSPRLLRDNLMPASTPEAWASEEKSHGSATGNDGCLGRPAAFAGFGASRSEKLKAGNPVSDQRGGESG